jgi:hypothetical protein
VGSDRVTSSAIELSNKLCLTMFFSKLPAMFKSPLGFKMHNTSGCWVTCKLIGSALEKMTVQVEAL